MLPPLLCCVSSLQCTCLPNSLRPHLLSTLHYNKTTASTTTQYSLCLCRTAAPCLPEGLNLRNCVAASLPCLARLPSTKLPHAVLLCLTSSLDPCLEPCHTGPAYLPVTLLLSCTTALPSYLVCLDPRPVSLPQGQPAYTSLHPDSIALFLKLQCNSIA